MRSGLPMHISKKFEECFKIGSSPASWKVSPDVEEVKHLLTIDKCRHQHCTGQPWRDDYDINSRPHDIFCDSFVVDRINGSKSSGFQARRSRNLRWCGGS